MNIRTYRKPVHTAVFIHKAGKIGVVNGTRLIRRGKIHQTVLQWAGIMQGKPATGNDIRKSAVFIEKLVEIQIITAHYKFNIDIRKLLLNV